MMKTSAAALACLAAMLGRTLAEDGDGGGIETDREIAPGCNGRHAWARNSTGEGCYNTDDDLNFLSNYGSFPLGLSGWNNWVEDAGVTTLDLWAKAPGCDINAANAEIIGTLEVTYTKPDATVLFIPKPGRTFVKHHLYIGCPKWVLEVEGGQQMPTIKPWKFPYTGSAGLWTAVPEVGYHGFSVQAHVLEEVCLECVDGEHVWARNSTGEGCFLDYPELPTATWGWTNWITQGTAETTLTLYAKAWNCNIGLWNDVVGTVVVKYDDQNVEYEFFPAPGVTFSEYDVYISCDKWQKKPSSELTVNPNFFHHKDFKKTVNWIGPHGFYVQAHAKRSCPTDPPRGPAPEAPPPTPRPPLQSNLCPIAMTVNGSSKQSFEQSCECEKFNCEKPTQPWSSRNMRFCRNCPAFLEDSYHFSCPHCAAAGTEVSFTCPNQWEACDVFVQVHSTCATGSTDGGLPYNLVSDGWTAGSCGPSFCLPFDVTCQNPGNNTAVVQPQETNIKWSMVLFHKQFAGGEEMEIPQFATEPTMYFTFFVREGRFCGNNNNETECAQQPSVCAWDAQRQDPCHAELCPQMSGQPPPGGACCDVPAGVSDGDCGAAETAITSVCSFHIPQCN